ncbi:transporter substrate-binding domain-containing protein [Hoeflea poritis]|uniref:Transporter substrate-binding domain-containing protein n=1 Tax=Hoeflea poritis TaxID=2993659 RepID=A0ABT4VSR3_9HYPH|nr:transporter substrate-binding domain-containing protein [Hoeflea poritis]MDA4847757.1 transporter substrate-binding domain-containing protein [Hoeflea poritis]
MKTRLSLSSGLAVALFAAAQFTGTTATPAQAAPSACSDSVQDYSVASGDTLSKIARVSLGDSLMWPRIYEYPGNADVIGNNPDLLLIGMQLRIPPCPGSVASLPKTASVTTEAKSDATGDETMTIYVVTGDNWPPFTDTKWPNDGMATEIIRAAFQASDIGANVEIDIIDDWNAQVTSLVKKDRYQMTFPWAMPNMDFWQSCDKLPEPMQIRCEYSKSKPIVNTTQVFFQEVGRSDLNDTSLDDVKKRRICRPKGYSTFDMVEAGFSIEGLVVGSSPQDCFQRLLEGSADYVALNRFVGLAVSYDMGISDSVEMSNFSVPGTLHLLAYATNDESNRYLEEFNVGLDRIIANGVYSQIVSFFNDEFTRRLVQK